MAMEAESRQSSPGQKSSTPLEVPQRDHKSGRNDWQSPAQTGQGHTRLGTQRARDRRLALGEQVQASCMQTSCEAKQPAKVWLHRRQHKEHRAGCASSFGELQKPASHAPKRRAHRGRYASRRFPLRPRPQPGGLELRPCSPDSGTAASWQASMLRAQGALRVQGPARDPTRGETRPPCGLGDAWGRPLPNGRPSCLSQCAAPQQARAFSRSGRSSSLCQQSHTRPKLRVMLGLRFRVPEKRQMSCSGFLQNEKQAQGVHRPWGETGLGSEDSNVLMLFEQTCFASAAQHQLRLLPSCVSDTLRDTSLPRPAAKATLGVRCSVNGGRPLSRFHRSPRLSLW